jgi:hypothetical protein
MCEDCNKTMSDEEPRENFREEFRTARTVNVGAMGIDKRPSIREEGQQRALADLRQSIWEVSQWRGIDDTLVFIFRVVREIEND